jgi:hypothetical protein
MQSFVSRHHDQIQGTLSGFDRLRFVGSLLRLSYVEGLAAFLGATGVLLKDFGDFMLKLSQRTDRPGHTLGARPLPAVGLAEQGGLHPWLARTDSARPLRPDRRPELRRALQDL